MADAPIWYSPQDVGRLLKINIKSVHAMLSDGTLRSFRHGRLIRIPSEALTELAEKFSNTARMP